MLLTSYQKIKQFPRNIRTWFSYLSVSFRRPSVLVIELTSLCNAQCTMCDKENSLRKKEHIKYTLFQKIIDDASFVGINKIQLSFYGESLLYPHLIDGLLYIRQKIPNAFITLNTNGILLTEDLSKKLLETKINSIAISIEGNNKEEYESIRVKLKWDVLRNNVQRIRKLIDEHNYPTKIGIMGLHVGNIKIDEDLYVKTWGAYSDTMFVRNENDLNDGQKEFFLHQVLPCNKLLSQFVVMASGEVTMCAYDWEGEVTYGNIKNSTILELWESPILKEKRLQHLLGRKKKLDLCNNCSYRVDNPFKKSNLL